MRIHRYAWFLLVPCLASLACAAALWAAEGRDEQLEVADVLADASPGAVIEPSSRLPTAPADAVGLRVRFGMKDQDNTDWSGGVALSQGRVTEIRGWRWAAGDFAKGDTWTVHTRRLPAQSEAERKQVQNGKKLPIVDNGVVLRLDGVAADTEVDIKTPQGNVKFRLADVPFGKPLAALEGNLEVQRAPVVTPLAATAADEDYPAVAVAKDGTIYVAWLAFTRGADFQGHRERLETPTVKAQTTVLSTGEVRTIAKPEDFDYLAEPTGGERIYVRACRNGKWEDPVAVTDGKHEYYRPAIAVDGTGKPWVFYSAHLDADANLDYGNWDLLVQALGADGKPAGDAVNVSHAPGSDLLPAAATDAAGNVWVAWMGAREAAFHVFVAHTENGKFTEPQRVSQFTANEWDPAIATDAKGNLAIAWDTYEKGDYDVYLVTRGADGKLSAPQAVAATLNFEVRPTLAYDRDANLWIAWEQSGDLWGKDFGALKKLGIPLYQGRSIGVKVRKADGSWAKPVGDVNHALPARNVGARNAKNANLPKQQIAPTFPRLVTDDQGNVWLAFRGRPPGGNWRLGVGSVWFEYITRYDGKEWVPASWVPRTNNILDNRPALAATPEHDVVMAFAGDGRGDVNPTANVADPNQPPPDPNKPVDTPAAAPAAAGGAQATGIVGAGGRQRPQRGGGGGRNGAAGPDPNNNLYLARFRSEAPTAAPELEAIGPEKPAEPVAYSKDEAHALKAIRDYRVELNGEKFQIWRGEFHRHTEFSPDGGGDGSLLDMWRYVLDAVSLDWVGDGDHDYGNGREYSWWTTQKAVTLFTLPGHFVPMFSYERSVVYPEGHRNVIFAKRGIRSLPRLPLSNAAVFAPAPDTQLLYDYLHHFDGVCAEHTSATNMGTDWRNNDPAVEPWVEIYQGDRNNYERPDAPRSAVREAQLKKSTPEEESFGGYKEKGFVNLALLKGYRLAFEASSDHISTHLSFANVLVTEPTRQNILEAIKKRRVYGATDNIIADVRCPVDGKDHFMGEEFQTSSPPTLHVHIIGAKKIAQVVIIKDDEVVYSGKPDAQEVRFEWTDPKPTAGKTSYYYVRGQEVADTKDTEGEIVWVSPMWIQYTGR